MRAKVEPRVFTRQLGREEGIEDSLLELHAKPRSLAIS
jgi:hypothetical protein